MRRRAEERPAEYRAWIPGTAPGETDMTVAVNRRADFTLDNFRRVAFAGDGVEIGLVARETMAAARRGFVALLESDRSAVIYGVTRRPGIADAVQGPPELQRAFARSFIQHSGH